MSTLPPPSQRIEIIDILRGFALLGIIMVHFTEQYYAGQAPDTVGNLGGKNVADMIVQGFMGILVQGKFFTIFSFLFGLSFFIQSDKSQGNSFYLRFAWRLLILLGIGFVHHLHYRGDILTIYAMLGFGLLLFHRLPDKALLIVALLLIADVPAFLTRLVQVFLPSGSDPFSSDQAALQVYYDTLKHGSYLSILKANFHEFGFKYSFQVFSGRIYITLGLFLLGVYAGRKQFFTTWESQLPFIKKMCRLALWTILGCILFMLIVFGGTALLKIEMPGILQWALSGLPYDIFNACLAMLYVLCIMLLFTKEKWKKRLHHLYAVGRMGLTTYLSQTLFGFLLFFSVGFGLLGSIGAALCLVIGLVVYLIQIQFSKWWLSRFQYGPVEWLWRSLTYLRLQPMKK